MRKRKLLWSAPPATAALAVGVVLSVAAPAQANETWRFESARGGGYAESCDRFGGRAVCAVVYCGRGVDGLEVGLTGWEPRGRGDRRDGRIEVDGRGRDVAFVREESPVVGEVWRVDMRRGGGRLINRLKRGLRFSADIAARAPAYDFTLRGSNAAIARLEERCDRVARRADRRDRRDDDADDAFEGGVIRIGDENFGLSIRIGDAPDDERRGRRVWGDDWVRLASLDVDRRRDRDVIDLDRRDGRFDALRLRVRDNDVRIRRVRVRYGNGQTEQLDVDRRINEGGRSDILELRGRRGRFIDRIVLVYDTQGRGPRAEVEVWGRRS